jgi:4-amino-4-deoxy-L-arabinose transferase-like glycosyltransferase
MFGSLFGTKSDIPFRMSSLVFGVLTLGITFFIVYPRKGLHAGLLAAGILASSWGFFRISRWIMVDISLVCGVTLALFAYLRLLDKSGTRDSIILGLATGLAFMAKGLIGPAIIAVAILLDFIRHKDITML